jgi:hypothetical protein
MPTVTPWTVLDVAHAALGAAVGEGDAFAPAGDVPAGMAGMVDEVLRRAATAWSTVPAARTPEPAESPAAALLRILGRDPAWEVR